MAINPSPNNSSFVPWSAGAAVGTSVVNGAINYGLQTQQQGWNEKMQDKQNAWSLNMWNMTNDYNDPSSQVRRLRDAGLNPLYYGLDGSSANGLESAQALGYNPASIDIANPVQSGLSGELLRAQIENTQVDTAKKANENLTETQRRQKIVAEIDNTRQQLINLKSTKKLTDRQVWQIDKALEWADRLNQAVVDEKESAKALNDSQKNRIEQLLEGEKILQSKSIDDFDKRWKKIDEEIAKMAEETGLLKEDIENYALNHASNGLFGSGLSIQNIIRALTNAKDVDYQSDNEEPFVSNPGQPNIVTNTD